MRRNYGDAAARHSTHNTQDHTHIHANISNGVVCARVEDASLAGSTGHGFRASRTSEPKTCRPWRTEEGEAELAGLAAVDCVTAIFAIRTRKKIATHKH